MLCMQAVFNGAEDSIKSGVYASRAVDHAKPFELGRFSFIRHSFINEWQPPRLTASEYLERAYQMADRFNRMFLRTLRQMRDLRRYQMPVTINNPKQVNIAADGGQQVNVQRKRRK